MKKYIVWDEYGESIAALDSEKEAIDLAEEIDGYTTEEEWGEEGLEEEVVFCYSVEPKEEVIEFFE